MSKPFALNVRAVGNDGLTYDITEGSYVGRSLLVREGPAFAWLSAKRFPAGTFRAAEIDALEAYGRELRAQREAARQSPRFAAGLELAMSWPPERRSGSQLKKHGFGGALAGAILAECPETLHRRIPRPVGVDHGRAVVTVPFPVAIPFLNH